MSHPNGMTGLPARAGVGLKPEHFRDVLEGRPGIGFFEVHAENYMVAGGPFVRYLERIRADYPLSVHGVGLSIGGDAPLDVRHLDRLSVLLDRFEPAVFSEHLAWSSHGGEFFNDLLPVPYDAATLQRVCRHVDQVQERLGRRLLLENPATYVEFATSTLSETEFIGEVVRRTGCGLLLDVNNVHVACTNHRRDASAYLRALPLHAVGHMHLAGFAAQVDADGGELLIDSHGAPVADVVWTLFREALALTGPQPTLLERDADIPPLAVLLAEAQRAQHLLDGAATLAGGRAA